MSTDTILQMQSHDAAETEKLAEQIGSRLRGSEVIVLSSDLGGGKTTFVRGLARGMGYQGVVSSPTFTISREYSGSENGLTLHHFDFYRLDDPRLMSLELAELVNDSGVVLAIEWANIVEGILPEDAITITITATGEEDRILAITYPPSKSYVFDGNLQS